MSSRNFGNQGPEIPHLSKGEVADLRSDVDAAFTSLEGEIYTTDPKVFWVAPATIMDIEEDYPLTIGGQGFGTDTTKVQVLLGETIALEVQAGMTDDQMEAVILAADLATLPVVPGGLTMALRLAVDGKQAPPVFIMVTGV